MVQPFASPFGPSPSGYANHRSPAALAAAVALNGAVVALLIAIPAATVMVQRTPPTPTRWIKLEPPPPPVSDPVEPAPSPHPAQKAVEPAPQPQPVVVDPAVSLGGMAATIMAAEAGPPLATLDAGPPQQAVPAPLLIAARPDPRYADAFRPDYPPALRRAGLEGSVTVRIAIDERGRVTAVSLVRATDPVFFEETRRQALRAWRFKPATRDGVAVSTEQVMTVHFRLE